MECLIHLGHVLFSALKGLKTLFHLQLSCLQTCTVPFEIKFKGVLISDTQPGVEHVHDSYQQKCLSLSNQTNPEPISLKRKYLTERYEVYKQLIGQHELYEKKKRLNESPEARENRLTRQCEYKRKIRANESSRARNCDQYSRICDLIFSHCD